MRPHRTIWLSTLAVMALSGCGQSQADRDREQARALKEAVGQVDLAPRPNETGTPIPFDEKAENLLLSAKRGKGSHVTAVTRRFSTISGYTYVKRDYDCDSPRFAVLAEADTLAALDHDQRPPSAGELVYGSSAHMAAVAACRKFGKELTSVKP